jgi:DNA-binding MarR family transcriptional regulator
MTRMPSKSVVRAWARLMRAQRIALTAVEAALRRAGMPPLAWYDVLLETERAGEAGARPFEIERTLLLAQYNLSRLLDRIEREGLIAREACVEDGRGQMVRITERGKALRRAMWPVYARAIESAVGERLNAGEAETLMTLLGRLVEPASGDC